jgi:predicted lipase
MNTVQDLWRFADLAYKFPADPESTILKGSIAIHLRNGLDGGYIAEFDNRLILAFSGTFGKFKSWLSDFEAIEVIDTDFGKLHLGFHNGWAAFQQPIFDYIRDNVVPDKPIFCTGHSRGGALSTLCAAHVAKKFKNPVSNIAFASPRVGKSDWRDIYEHMPIYTTRVVNGYDVVPTVPFEKMGFRHVGRLLHFPQPLWHKYFSRVQDHYQENYKVAIDLWKPDIS